VGREYGAVISAVFGEQKGLKPPNSDSLPLPLLLLSLWLSMSTSSVTKFL